MSNELTEEEKTALSEIKQDPEFKSERRIIISDFSAKDVVLSFETPGTVHTISLDGAEELIINTVLARCIDPSLQNAYETYRRLHREPESRWVSPDPPPGLDHRSIIRFVCNGMTTNQVSLFSALDAYADLTHIEEQPAFKLIDSVLFGAVALINLSIASHATAEDIKKQFGKKEGDLKVAMDVSNILELCQVQVASLKTAILSQVSFEVGGIRLPVSVSRNLKVDVSLAIDSNPKGLIPGPDPKPQEELYHEHPPVAAIDVILRCISKRRVA